MVCGSQLKKLKLKIQGLNWYPRLAILLNKPLEPRKNSSGVLKILKKLI